MKRLSLLLTFVVAAAVLGSASASAQEKEKVVTGTITLLTPTKVTVLDEFISSQQYTGGKVFNGFNVRLGAIYRNHDNLSWDLYYTGFNRAKIMEENAGTNLQKLENPAKSQSLKYSSYNVGYGTYYHWQFGEKLMLKTGGLFDLYGGMKTSTPDGVNNATNLDGQIMLKSHTAIKYGWDFKKWGLDFRAHVSIPVMGLMIADHPSESAVSLLGANDHSIQNPNYRHIFMAFYHNYMSLDYELGVDFVFKPCTLTLGLGGTSKRWNVYDIQNIRKISYMTLGVAFDIVSRDKFKSTNRNF